jgi:hypothetical protein
MAGMQFKLSTLMVMVAAVALGCMGWKLGDGTIHDPNDLAIFVYALSWCLLLFVLLKNGLQVLLPCLIGFVLHTMLVLANSGLFFAFILVPITAGPITLFSGSLYLALTKREPEMIRYLLFMPSCVLLGWFLAVVYYDPVTTM